MSSMNKSLKRLYLYIFFQLCILTIVYFIFSKYPFKGFYVLALIMIVLSIVSDVFIFYIIDALIQKEQEQLLLEEHKNNMKNDELFFKFCELQQMNIRHYYHDLNNHLITLKILKDENKIEEYNAYLSSLKENYNKLSLEHNTDDVLLDTMIEYFQKDGIQLDIQGHAEDIDYLELLDTLNVLAKKNTYILVDLSKKCIHANTLLDTSKNSSYRLQVIHNG